MRKKVAYIFQNSNLLEEKSVFYHLSPVYKLNKERVDTEEIEQIMDFLRISHLKNNPSMDLSGGEKQKVAIAMALLQKPEILLSFTSVAISLLSYSTVMGVIGAGASESLLFVTAIRNMTIL